MDVFKEYIARIDSVSHQERIEEVLAWVIKTFPNLKAEIKWNTPMFSDHGTYIIGFSTAKNHLSVSPEAVGIAHFISDIEKAGYSYTEGLFRVKWHEQFDYELLEKMIAFNIQDKADYTSFWRK